MVIVSHSPYESQSIAAKFVPKIKGHILLLEGELGSGKTIFVQGLANGLKIKDPVKSPTFTLLRIYTIKKHPRFSLFCHADLYRVHSLRNTGLGDYLKDPKVLVAMEWPKEISSVIRNAIRIQFEHLGGTKRKIIFRG